MQLCLESFAISSGPLILLLKCHVKDSFYGSDKKKQKKNTFSLVSPVLFLFYVIIM